jgi:hypothetical protein
MIVLFGSFLLGHIGWFIHIRGFLNTRRKQNEELMKNELQARQVAKERLNDKQ